MCGIAGYFGLEEIAENNIKNCLNLMKRRGPDHQAYQHWKNNSGRNVYLLSSRLKIIDLEERSNQPFNTDSKWMIFNGELYNYKELKEDLLKKECVFKTESDTEVLLQMINKYGIQGLDKCEGMWAFAVYDTNDGSLILSRDRFGEKPLYFYKKESGIYFGSEIKFIKELIGHKLEINFNHLYRYLVDGYKSLYKSSETFFKNLEEVGNSTIVHINPDGKEHHTKYWHPNFFPNNALSYEDAVKEVRERLITSVKLRLRADVPLAFCMSGGVDSNALISIAKNIFNYDVHGFTIVNTDERYEEQEMVEHVVSELGIKHTPIPLEKKDFLPKLNELIKYHDSPIYTISYFVHWMLMENMAKKGYKISISGTAADELFTGYFDHHLAFLHEIRNTKLYESYLKAWEMHIKPIVRNPFLSDPELFIKNKNFREHIYLNAEEFSKYLNNNWNEEFKEQKFTDDLLRNRMMNEMFQETVPVILHEDDLNAMYHSIENRSPYLDKRLFEFCNTIPTEYLMKDGYNKIILREAVRGIVPDKILNNRRKVGFNAPILDLLDLNKPEVVDYLSDNSPVFDHVKKDKIKKLTEGKKLSNSESKFLFNFINTKMFLEGI